jgi:hypothetical protein
MTDNTPIQKFSGCPPWPVHLADRRFRSGFENSSAIDSQPPQDQASNFLRSE